MEIGFLGEVKSTVPTDVNDLRQVIGMGEVQPPHYFEVYQAFFWQEGVLTHLGSLSDRESSALQINELGQAVGASVLEPGRVRAVLWRPLLTPEQRIEVLVRQIESLIDSGALGEGPGNALLVSLYAALAKLSEGNTSAACNTLGAFANKVEAFLGSGELTEADGNALLAAVNAIHAELCG